MRFSKTTPALSSKSDDTPGDTHGGRRDRGADDNGRSSGRGRRRRRRNHNTHGPNHS
jgi:hypothetical protein